MKQDELDCKKPDKNIGRFILRIIFCSDVFVTISVICIVLFVVITQTPVRVKIAKMDPYLSLWMPIMLMFVFVPSAVISLGRIAHKISQK